METVEVQSGLPFYLEFDKLIPFQIKIAEWNPEKDLLAVVTEDSKIMLHRFNWQRIWMISHGRCVTSLCWHPDGKVIAVGLQDGTISLHDVENGKLLRSMKFHTVAIMCLNWEDDGQDDCSKNPTYEDRTSRFFPPPPRAPQMPVLVCGDDGLMNEAEDSFTGLSNLSHQRFNILCSGDDVGNICFMIFGIFPIAKVNIHDFSNCIPPRGNQYVSRLQNASINKVSLSKDLCHLTIMCSGELLDDGVDQGDEKVYVHGSLGLYCLVLDTSIFLDRKNELHQVAQQASSIVDLTEVIRASISVMLKQWSDAMKTFHQKFDSLSSLINDHGLKSSPQEEFLRLLGGLRASPPLHQFLLNSLGEAGVKRVSKHVCGTGKDLQELVHNHIQPAADIIGFRVGELRGLSKWRSRYQCIGLDETLLDDATEKAGMLIVQVVRFMKILSSVSQQFSNFFIWLQKSIKLEMDERSDHLQPFSSELVVIFLIYLYNQDPVKLLLEISEVQYNVDIDKETVKRVEELVLFGGFSDTDYLRRTLAKQFQLTESCLKEALLVPFTTVSKKIFYEDLLPLFPLQSLPASAPQIVPTSISYYKDDVSEDGSVRQTCKHRFLDYISFRIPDESPSCIRSCIGIVRGFLRSTKEKDTSMEAILLSFPYGFTCVDLSLYKENQLVVLLNETNNDYGGSENAHIMVLQISEVLSIPVPRLISSSQWLMHGIKDYVTYLQMENKNVRGIPHSVVAPLAVSAARGLACVFCARKRALVYNLEDEEEEEEKEFASD